MAIDYKSLYRYGGYTTDQKRHLARLLATAEAATTSAEVSRKVVHKSLAGKFARDETERWQRYFEGIRAAIDAENASYDIDPHVHGWRNYQLERLIKSFAATIIGDKPYTPDGFTPSNDLTSAGGDWNDGLFDAIQGYGTPNAGLGGNTDTTLEDNASGAASSNFLQAQKSVALNASHDSIVCRLFVKKIATPTSAGLLYIEADGDSYAEAYYEFSMTTGADTGGSYNSEGSYSGGVSAYDSNYLEILCRIAPAAGLNPPDSLYFHIYPASTLATDVQTIEVGNVEAYWDTTIAAIEGTDPVFLS